MSHTETVYLLHFDEPIGDTASKFGYAQHYTGSTPDLLRRLAKHQAAPDAKIMQAVQQAGIGWVLARTWEGGRLRERGLKRQGGASRHCPVCKGQPPAAETSFRAIPQPGRRAERLWAVVEAVPAAVPQPRRPALREAVRAAEPEALEDSLSARVTATEARALDALLADAEATAWSAGWDTPGLVPDQRHGVRPVRRPQRRGLRGQAAGGGQGDRRRRGLATGAGRGLDLEAG